MKRVLLLFMWMSLISLTAAGQKTFNGTVRAYFSQNAVVKEIESDYGDKPGDRLIAWIDKKVSTSANAREKARLLRANGTYEQFIKVKGNKVVTYDTRGISFVLFDADIDSIYTVYPTNRVGTVVSINDYLDEIGMNGAVISNPKETDISILGKPCKVVESILFGDSACLERIWYSDDIKMPKKYVECYMYDGLFGFPLMKSFDINNYNVAKEGFYEVTEIVEEDIPDEVFRIPDNIVIMPLKKLNSYLSKGRIAYSKEEKKKMKKNKNKKVQENAMGEKQVPIIGVLIPEVFWDF